MDTKTNRIKYDHLVIAIPHSHPGAGKWQWEADSDIKAWRDRYTDWYTDELFDAEAGSITVVKGDISRLDCDLERLEHEYDRLCNFTNISHSSTDWLRGKGALRNYCLAKWYKYRADILDAASLGHSLIIDCHSFPEDIAPDVDICIGFNDDASRPSDEVIISVRRLFEAAGYTVAFNRPFANAIAPLGYVGHSLMVEINKKTYMNEATLGRSDDFVKLRSAILDLYALLLDS